MITDLRLQNFRSYKDGSFKFNSGVNIIVGPNASGKTNLLEAILVLARGNSYRVRDNELINFGQPWARLDEINESGSKRIIKINTEPLLTKTYEIDNQVFKRLSLAHSLPVVLFEPNHLQLFAGGPERRRDYLDDLLEQTTTGYSTTRRHYKRALAQRNSLLKQGHGSNANQFFPWNLRLSQLAGQIVRARTDLVERLNKDITELYKELSQADTSVSLSYGHRWSADNYETNFLKKLETDLDRDQLRGFTGSGPHREDLLVMYDDRLATETASRGEVRTAVLALKILELKILADARQQTPLLLLDDVFSELDARRRQSLTDYLADYQTFITTTDADLITKNFSKNTNIIELT